uniref:Uncharacterized protein n=1 Tax=Romanomermis culicivorax TaxID=13658 RepID=A0A915HHC2_ROMCU
MGTADDCVIFVGGGSSIWSKLKVRRAAVAALGELDRDRRDNLGFIDLSFKILPFCDGKSTCGSSIHVISPKMRDKY